MLSYIKKKIAKKGGEELVDRENGNEKNGGNNELNRKCFTTIVNQLIVHNFFHHGVCYFHYWNVFRVMHMYFRLKYVSAINI